MDAIIVNGTAKEIAALAFEVQGRHGVAGKIEVPTKTLAKAVHEAIGGIAEESQDSSSQSSCT